MSSRKGTRYERELVNALTSFGYGVVRIPSSGSATDRDLPDILAGHPHDSADALSTTPVAEAWAIEHKSGNATTLYVDEGEVEDLRAFAEAFGARPLLGARPVGNGGNRVTYLLDPEDARITDGGNYGLPVSDVAERASFVVDATEGVLRPV